ncbi:hypothetical protein H7U18_27955 [Klebsiella pneumoniae]|uniref:Uncharacterized protein n=1 Tax=Klebsiella pneumoniae TaxID=573 RepID=A0A923EMQ6_KLEPN|nr:hypothetical protein [Klebsiella pneumoniae]
MELSAGTSTSGGALNIEFRESDKLKQEAIEKLAERIDQHLDHVSELFDKTEPVARLSFSEDDCTS